MLLDGQQAATAEGLRQLELAALPTSLEWHVWWQEWSRHVEEKAGWERAIADAITRLVRNQLTLARMIRNEGNGKMMIKYNSDGYVSGEETREAADITREALAWYIQMINPTKKDAPEWAKILFKGVEGCYIQQARLGIELSAIKKKGYLTVNHSALAPNPDAFDPKNTEIL